ncbi:MAG: DegT/DnrJ/EryC1/StrS family aminotransferase [Thaumarchaeota archaeon]|nr:DegT/DnrJ/EryC1/StrS family aminotransferase [Nitrososphaerota archaeon]
MLEGENLVKIEQMAPWFGREEADAVAEYMRSGAWITEYARTREFEDALANFAKSQRCVVVSNGTVSLFVALLGLGVKPGDEVIVPDLTQIASANSAILAGARPVLADISPDDLSLDLADVKRKLTDKTKAIVLVSLNGRCPRIREYVEFARSNSLRLVEDAAQSLGSQVDGKQLGTFGDVGSFSFSTPKIISTGQGGALVTDDLKLDENFRRIKDFGRIASGVDKHVTLGYNFKFTDLQAVVGIEQMKKLPWRVERKKKMFDLYRESLSRVEQVKFIDTDTKQTPPWAIDIICEKRESLISFLSRNGIGSRTFHPPIHTQMPYALEPQGSFPVSEEVSRKGLWLPSSSFLTDEQILEICKEVKKFYQ